MTRYVAFLRAINIGGRTVKMDRLREVFESLGFENVATVIASGNVVFESRSGNTAALEKKIEDELQRSLGFDVKTYVRSAAELRQIAEHRPFNDAELTDEATAYVAFLSSPLASKAVERLMAARDDVYDFDVRGREIYLLRRRIPKRGLELEKVIGALATIRNITTVRKLAAKCLV